MNLNTLRLNPLTAQKDAIIKRILFKKKKHAPTLFLDDFRKKNQTINKTKCEDQVDQMKAP